MLLYEKSCATVNSDNNFSVCQNRRFDDYSVTEFFSILKSHQNLNITIKISSLAQLDILAKYITENLNINAVEYGEIAKTIDLQKYNIYQIAEKIHNFCIENQLKFIYSTPEILIERDFARVYSDVKNLINQISPYALKINNKEFFKKYINDDSFNAKHIQTVFCCFDSDYAEIRTVDLSDYNNLDDLKNILKKSEHIPFKQYKILGNFKIKTSNVCPLNDKDKPAGIYCTAPCTKGIFYIKDNSTNRKIKFITDGFCNVHYYSTEILNLTEHIPILSQGGINNFLVDFSSF